MPLYEYQCESCQHRFEKIRKFSDPPLETCPVCSGPVRKLLSSPAFQFKGTGWYITDYGKKPSTDGSTEGGSKEKSETGKSETGKSESGKSESGKSESGKSESGKSETGKSEKSDARNSDTSSTRDSGTKTTESPAPTTKSDTRKE